MSIDEFGYLAAHGVIEEWVADYLSGGITAADLDQQDIPPLQWAVPGVVPEGLVMLAGAPKTGKSWLVLALALGIASGGVALGRIRVDPRPVLYFALEDGHRRLQQRVRTLLGGEPVPDRLTFQIKLPPGRLTDVIRGWLTQNPDGLVIVDTLGRARPPQRTTEPQYSADYRVMSALKELVDERPGSSLLVVHHTRKQAAADPFDTVSGTTGLTGGVDTTLVLTRPRGEDEGVLEVTGRDVPEGSYALVSRGGSWELDGRDLAAAAARAEQVKATTGVGDRMADVIDYVNRAEGAVRAGDVAEALDLDKDQAGVYLRRAAANERIGKNGRGSYTPVRSVWSVRNEDSRSNTPNTTNTPPLRQCDVCGFRLDPALGDVTAHPSCEETA